jgi:hypothetical protein
MHAAVTAHRKNDSDKANIASSKRRGKKGRVDALCQAQVTEGLFPLFSRHATQMSARGHHQVHEQYTPHLSKVRLKPLFTRLIGRRQGVLQGILLCGKKFQQ